MNTQWNVSAGTNRLIMMMVSARMLYWLKYRTVASVAHGVQADQYRYFTIKIIIESHKEAEKLKID